MNKKDIGSALALYPTPLVVVGTMVDGKPNWTLVGHLGIIGHDHVMVSMAAPHHSNKGIKATRTLSINVVDRAILEQADYAGCVSGAKTDKSELFAYETGAEGAPIIEDAKVAMECAVEDIYETKGFESFICTISHTYADESVLNDKGKIDYGTFKPILFEMPNYTYLETGETVAPCMSFGKGRK